MLDYVAVLAVALVPASNLEAQAGKGTIKIATQSPLSGGQAALGEGIKLGAQLALDKLKGNLTKQGFKVELVPFDDQAKPDVGVGRSCTRRGSGGTTAPTRSASRRTTKVRP